MSVIKVKMRNARKAKLLTPNGGLTQLRIHAMTGDAEVLTRIAADVARDNAEQVEWAKVTA